MARWSKWAQMHKYMKEDLLFSSCKNVLLPSCDKVKVNRVDIVKHEFQFIFIRLKDEIELRNLKQSFIKLS